MSASFAFEGPYSEDEKLLPGGRFHEREEAMFQRQKQPRTLKWLSPQAVILVAFNLILSTAIVILVTMIFHPKPQLSGDINRMAPTFSEDIVTFQPDARAVRNLTDASFVQETLSFWLSLVPKGLGFLYVQDHQKYDLQPPYHMHGKPVYSTSVTHQLHCLYMIMKSYNSLIVDGYSPPADGELDPTWHLAHCFDYIRQGIMCAGDTALEGEETTFPESKNGTDGWNTKHVCKNYGQVRQWLETMAVDNRTWIL